VACAGLFIIRVSLVFRCIDVEPMVSVFRGWGKQLRWSPQRSLGGGFWERRCSFSLHIDDSGKATKEL